MKNNKPIIELSIHITFDLKDGEIKIIQLKKNKTFLSKENLF